MLAAHQQQLAIANANQQQQRPFTAAVPAVSVYIMRCYSPC